MRLSFQPELLGIGTCLSCVANPCLHPRKAAKDPRNGCSEWTDGVIEFDDHLRYSEKSMPPLDIKREKRIAELLNTSVDDCKIKLQRETDRELLEHLHRRAEDREHKTRSKYIQQRLNQLTRHSRAGGNLGG